ncbi:MAG: four helix bundle protein [Burkholderiales bacterium]|jgi:four helix bundle protein|nr:four helix bundle protein [Burkholderiales bacterium]
MELTETLYGLTEQLPRTEQFGLVTQLRRASVSVASNIAEGHARESTKEYLRFLSMALGSIAEMETQLILCERLKLLPATSVSDALALAGDIGKMIRALRRSLNDRLP